MSTTPDAPLRVLLVDDDELDRAATARALRSGALDYDIVQARSGHAGVALVSERAFDAVLLDYRLPGEDGIEVLRRLREASDGAVAVLMLSGQDDDWLAAACIDAGAQDFLLKSEVTSRRLTRALMQARQRHGLELRLRSSEALLNSAARIAGVGGWEIDLRAQVLHWSPQTKRIHEVEPDYVPVLEQALGFYAPRARAAIAKAVEEGARDGKDWDLTLPLITAKGRLRWARSVGTVVFHAGQAVRLIGTVQDVTERTQADLDLHQTMALLNAVLDSATQVAIVATKPDGVVSVFNAGAQQMLGYGADEVVGKLNAQVFYDPAELQDRATALSERLGRKIETTHVALEPERLGQPQDWTYRRKDGSAVAVSLAITAMRDADGKVFGYLGIAHDVSRQKMQERGLRDAVREAKKAGLASRQFLANMSHEIRTPMNAVIGLSYLLERTPLNAEQADTLGKIKLASKSLLSLINDVLDLSKIEAAEMHIERAPFALGEVLSELTALVRLQADAKRVVFTVQATAELPLIVEGDATRLRQVLTNLLSNAIKFTERGAVQLTVDLLAQQERQVRLRFSVKDTGIGIAPEALPRLFAPFVQADASTTRRFGGTGLGLSIVKQLVALMGGEVGVTSVLQQGSEFWVELDFRVCSDSAFAALEEPAQPEPGPGLSGVRVLIADDSIINLEVARRILELEGATVWLAHDGQQAVDHLLSNPDGVDVVLMDVQMPVLDGHDATQRIRSALGLTTLPVIALTAGISTGEQMRVAASGMNDLVGKPFEAQSLVRCIQKHVRMNTGARTTAPMPTNAGQAAWPQIEGIDSRDVSARFGGDVALFSSMLQRLLLDSRDLAGLAVAADVLSPMAARMHEIKGSAGTLGASSLAKLAAHVEDACRAGAPEQAAALLREVVSELEALERAARPMLEASQARESNDDEAPLEPLNAAALDALLVQLTRSDLAALQSFKALAAHLRQLMDADAFRALGHRVDTLQFSEAASVLRTLISSRAQAPT